MAGTRLLKTGALASLLLLGSVLLFETAAASENAPREQARAEEPGMQVDKDPSMAVGPPDPGEPCRPQC